MVEEKRSTRDLIDRYQGYRNDPASPAFRNLVDLIVAMMIEHKLAPDEVRDAAYLASIKFLQMHPVKTVYVRDDIHGQIRD